MSDRRRGLGRGLGALIPTGPDPDRPRRSPVDLFFPEATDSDADVSRETATSSEPAIALEAPDAAPVSRETSRSRTRKGAVDAPTADPVRQGSRRPAAGQSSARTSTAATGSPTTSPPEAPGGAGTSGDQGAPGNDVSRETGVDLVDDGGLLPVEGARFAEIPVTAIQANARQPRQVFDEDAMRELVHSIGEIGLLQPIVVRSLPPTPAGSPDAPGVDAGQVRYELIMGERRWRATRAAGLDVIPAIVRDTDDTAMLRDALLENLHRSQLNPLEEAAAYQQLLEDFGCTHDELAARIGRSRPQISNTVRLLRLPPLVQRRVAAGVISAGHARALLALSDGSAQERLAQRIVAEGLSVRTVEEVVALGEAHDEQAEPRRRTPKAAPPELAEIASALSEQLETRVKVDLGRTKGKITVEFASVEDLERIVGAIAPSALKRD